MRWQRGMVIGAAGLLLLAVGLWLGVRWGAPAPQPVVTREPDRTPPPSEPVARAPVETPAPTPASPRPASPPPPTTPAPTPAGTVGSTDEEEEVRLPPPPADQPDTREDRFESQDGGEPEIRTVLAVGDIRMGVIRGSEIRDQAAFDQVLVRIGSELERRMQSAQPKERSERAMQKLLDDYQEELGKHMSGEVELRGPGFSIGTEVGPPLPREKWWKPRPQ